MMNNEEVNVSEKERVPDEFTIVMDDPTPVDITVNDNGTISKHIEELTEPQLSENENEMEESLRQVEQEFDIIKEYLCTLQKSQSNSEKPEILSNRIRSEILEKTLCILRSCKELENEEIIKMDLSMLDSARREAASMNMLQMIAEKIRGTFIDEQSMNDLNKRYLSFQSSLQCSIDCVKDQEDLYKTTQLKLIELKKENDTLRGELSIEKQKCESVRKQLEMTKQMTQNTKNKMKNVLSEARSLREDIERQKSTSNAKNEMTVQMGSSDGSDDSLKSEQSAHMESRNSSASLVTMTDSNDEKNSMISQGNLFVPDAVHMSGSSKLLDEPDESCVICDRVFPPNMDVTYRRSHVTSHFKKECYICNMKFNDQNLDKLIIHLKSCEAFYL